MKFNYTYADSSRLCYNNPEAMEFHLFRETGIIYYHYAFLFEISLTKTH